MSQTLRVSLLLAMMASHVSAAPIPAPPSTPTATTTTTRHAHFHGEAIPAGALPTRIVSLSPIVTETLFRLGVGDRVVGVTRYCDRPAEAKNRVVVGGYTDASLEVIVGLRPDLVVAQPSFQQRSMLDRLRERHVPVFVVFADAVDESVDMMTALGALMQQPERARQLVAALDTALHPPRDPLQSATPMASGAVVVIVGADPLIVAGRGSFADDAVRAVGADSAIHDGDPAWPQWSLETVAARHTRIVIAAEGPQARARLEHLLAPLGALAPRVVAADTAILMRPGPSFADDVVTLRHILEAPTP